MDGHGFAASVVFLWPLVMFGVVGLVFWLAWQQNKKRRAAAQAFAASRGWTWSQAVPALTYRWRSYPFGRGSARRANNVLTGSFHGQQVVSFEYQYTVRSGKSSTTYHFHIVALSLPVPLPWLQLTPEGAGASIAKFFGGQDIQFESQAFNDAWRVMAAPGQYAHDFIHPRMMDRLLAPDALGRSIVVENADIYAVVPGLRDVASIDYLANLLYGIEELIPRHLWLKVGYEPGVRS